MFWKSSTIDEDKIYYIKIGPLELWIKRKYTDWYISSKREATGNDFVELQPLETILDEESLSWNQWVISSTINIIRVKPVMPDKAVIIYPEIPIRIPPGNAGKFFITIPVWIKLEIGKKNPIPLTELPVNILSKSWFGDTFTGELCYSKKSMIRKDVKEIQNDLCCAICSVKIKNSSKLELDLTRFCLQVENLSIFSDTEHLCTNHVDVFFRGKEQESQITISNTHSSLLKNYSLISEPREKIDRNIIKLSYQFFKSFTGSY